jgi:hypothetical protein
LSSGLLLIQHGFNDPFIHALRDRMSVLDGRTWPKPIAKSSPLLPTILIVSPVGSPTIQGVACRSRRSSTKMAISVFDLLHRGLGGLFVPAAFVDQSANV